MDKILLTINAGSSSIKFACFKIGKLSELHEDVHGQVDNFNHLPNLRVTGEHGETLVDTTLADVVDSDYQRCINIIYSWLLEYLDSKGSLCAVGHRIVHGGSKYTATVLIDDEVLDDLEQLIPLAPLHQPQNIMAIRAFREVVPGLPQVACFDTAFHRSQPEVAQQFAIPHYLFDGGVRRYGFHGLSYEYIASQLPSLDPALSDARTIVAHLGNGASLCALRNGRSVATTMGFSPLDGLVMGTRCGAIDPGVILYLMQKYQMDADAIQHLLYYESGLLGVSGLSGDMRILSASSQPSAKVAIDLFVYRAVCEIGSLVAALGGLDALIFTGGIGENAVEIRHAICAQLSWLGLEMDKDANRLSSRLISLNTSKLKAWVVKTNESLMIALHTKKQIGL